MLMHEFNHIITNISSALSLESLSSNTADMELEQRIYENARITSWWNGCQWAITTQQLAFNVGNVSMDTNKTVFKDHQIEGTREVLRKELSNNKATACSVMYPPKYPPLGEVGRYMTEPPVMYLPKYLPQ